MVSLINLPGYQPSPLMDFGQINQALQSRQQAQARADQMAMQQAQQAEQARQFNAGHQLAQRSASRADAKSPYEQALLDAQAKAQRAHAGLYDTQSANVRAMANAKAAPTAPPPTFGQRPDGSVYEINEGGVSLDQASGGVDISSGAGRFGARGLAPADVPGMVVNPRGSTDLAATRANAGQEAVASTPEEDRKRFETYKRTQDHWTYLNNGKPAGVGKAYAADGRIIELGSKDTATDRQARVIAQHGLANLDKATEALVGVMPDPKRGIADVPPKVGALGQLAGDSWKVPGTDVDLGGWGEGGRAFRNARMTVMDLNFALSGKGVSNAERTAFIDLYMPKSTDSRETQAQKLGAIKQFFSSVMAARNTGATDEQIAEIYRGAMIREPARQNGAPQQQPVASPGVKKYGNKYQGLE